MESAQDSKLDWPFDCQPKPVKVTIEGVDMHDVLYWAQQFIRAVEFKGDVTQKVLDITKKDLAVETFTIYPRAVND